MPLCLPSATCRQDKNERKGKLNEEKINMSYFTKCVFYHIKSKKIPLRTANCQTDLYTQLKMGKSIFRTVFFLFSVKAYVVATHRDSSNEGLQHMMHGK